LSDKIEARCLEDGWQLERIFLDAGDSGGTPLGKRPERTRLLAAVGPGEVIISAEMDRIVPFRIRRAADRRELQSAEYFAVAPQPRGTSLILIALLSCQGR
jgi:DNA invertase Pin-like site-specific DNA recombinase